MFDTKTLDDLAQRLANVLPPGMQAFQDEVKKNFQAVLQSTFAKMDLVTREEFDVQSAVLERTRLKLEALENQVAVLEKQVFNKES